MSKGTNKTIGQRAAYVTYDEFTISPETIKQMEDVIMTLVVDTKNKIAVQKWNITGEEITYNLSEQGDIIK